MTCSFSDPDSNGEADADRELESGSRQAETVPQRKAKLSNSMFEEFSMWLETSTEASMSFVGV